MPSAQRREVFDVSREALYRVIIDYKRYPEFVDNVTRMKIVKHYDDKIRATFYARVIKEFSYTLDLYHDEPKKVWWELVRGDLFKRLDGSWDLKKKSKHKTEVTYTAEVEAKIKIPGGLVSTLVGSGLPKMMRQFCARAQELG